MKRSLRERTEKDLAVTLEGAWSLPVNFVGPDGTRTDDVRCQVLYDTVRTNPETGEPVVVALPVVVARRATLLTRALRVPAPGETWFIEVPETPSEAATKIPYMMSSDRPPEGGASIGFIRIYLQEVEQV